jgi:hypothetical protein
VLRQLLGGIFICFNTLGIILVFVNAWVSLRLSRAFRCMVRDREDFEFLQEWRCYRVKIKSLEKYIVNI